MKPEIRLYVELGVPGTPMEGIEFANDGINDGHAIFQTLVTPDLNLPVDMRRPPYWEEIPIVRETREHYLKRTGQ